MTDMAVLTGGRARRGLMFTLMVLFPFGPLAHAADVRVDMPSPNLASVKSDQGGDTSSGFMRPWLAFGIGYQLASVEAVTIGDEPQSDDSVASEVYRVEGGLSLTSFLSVGVSASFWGVPQDEAPQSDESDFNGYSTGLHGRLTLPLQGLAGPWIDVGHHCWDTSMASGGRVQRLDGCSPVYRAGWSFPVLFEAGSDDALYLEYMQTQFDDNDVHGVFVGIRGVF